MIDEIEDIIDKNGLWGAKKIAILRMLATGEWVSGTKLLLDSKTKNQTTLQAHIGILGRLLKPKYKIIKQTSFKLVRK